MQVTSTNYTGEFARGAGRRDTLAGERAMPDGIRDDTFLHLVDAWWAREVERHRTEGEQPEELGVEGMPGEAEIRAGVDDFMACKGDRFRNSADLARHFEEWVSLDGGANHPEARRLIEDVLGFWRSIEPQRRAPRKPRS